jgi:HEAT repeat protein
MFVFEEVDMPLTKTANNTETVKSYLAKKRKRYNLDQSLARKFKRDVAVLVDVIPDLTEEFLTTRNEWKTSSPVNQSSAYKKYAAANEYLEDTISALGIIKDEKAVQALIAIIPALQDEGGLLVKIAVSLGFIGDDKAVKSICGLLTNDYDKLRSAAVEALGNIKSSQAVESLLATLKDSDFGVRRATVIALGKIGDKRAIDDLLVIEDRRHWEGICAALGDIAEKGDERVIGFLKEAVVLMMDRGADYSIRIAACNALGRIGDKKGIELLNSVIANDPWYLVDEETKEPVEWPVRDAAYKALKEIKRRMAN